MTTKTYTIKLEHDIEKGQIILTRTNDGFSAIELLGIITHAQKEILDQISGKTMENKDVIKRQVVE